MAMTTPRFSDEKIREELARFLDIGADGPGSTLHHLVLATEHSNALGLPTLGLSVTAISPQQPPPGQGTVQDFMTTAIASAILRTREKAPIYLACLLLEMASVPPFELLSEEGENRARRMLADGHLDQHEEAVETTRLYAADADGRRWRIDRWHTGPIAGRTSDLMMATAADPVGSPIDQGIDEVGAPYGHLIRSAARAPARKVPGVRSRRW